MTQQNAKATEQATRATIDRFDETLNRHDADTLAARFGEIAANLAYVKG